jgi:hypothetical protein
MTMPLTPDADAAPPRRNLAPLAGYGLAAAVSACVWALLLTSLL